MAQDALPAAESYIFLDPVEIPKFPPKRLYAVDARENWDGVGAFCQAISSTAADIKQQTSFISDLMRFKNDGFGLRSF